MDAASHRRGRRSRKRCISGMFAAAPVPRLARMIYLKPKSSTSKTSVLLGGMTGG
jgi:hypothetical protein